MSSSTTPLFNPPAKIEDMFEATGGNRFASINAPTAGARVEKALPCGDAPVQLYSLGTPNGKKVTILFEELGIDYDAFTVNIMAGEQFTSGFTEVNPNGKIPCCVDREGPDGKPMHLFESGSIALYFAEKYQKFVFSGNKRLEQEVRNWVFWQMGCQGPFTGQFGHFFAYAPADAVDARTYGVSRYGMETMRLLDVLNNHLATRTYLVGEEYSLADIICFPWVAYLVTGGYKSTGDLNCADFLTTSRYEHVVAWHARIAERPAVQRGMTVNSWTSKHAKPWLHADEENE